MSDTLVGKVAVITGAGGNLGQAVSRRLQAAGAQLVLVGRSDEELAAITAATGGYPVVADVTDPDSIDALVAAVEERFGQIDILAHTVGGYSAGQPVHESGLDVWDRMMTLNARSVYVTAGRFAAHMVGRGVSGRIVVILARAAYKGSARHAAYTASKAAAQRIVESMAAELLTTGITVNGIAPSIIDTPPNRASMPNADFSRWVQPDEIADAVAFLASPTSGAITGITLDINGGV